MKKAAASLLTALASLALAAGAGAQVCAGLPMEDRRLSVGGSLGVSDSASFVGGEVSVRLPGPLFVFGGVDVATLEEDAPGRDRTQETYELGLAFEPRIARIRLGPAAARACLVLQAAHTDLGEVGSIVDVPFGLGVGGRLSLGSGLSLLPYGVAQVVVSNLDFNDDLNGEIEDRYELYQAVRAGALVGTGRFYAGGEASNLFGDSQPPVFSLRAGIRL